MFRNMIFVIIFDRPPFESRFQIDVTRTHRECCRTGRIKINYENHFQSFDIRVRLSGSFVCSCRVG